MVVRGVQMFMGLDPDADGWALREVKRLCGLTLGGEDATEDRLLSDDDGCGLSDRRPKLRLVAGTDVEPCALDDVVDPQGLRQGVVGEHLHAAIRSSGVST